MRRYTSSVNERVGWLVLREGIRYGRITFDDRIRSIEATGPVVAVPSDDGPIVAPGFVDVHVHGGGGGDVMDGVEGVRTMARHHRAHGTTTILPTTLTHPWEAVLQALRDVAVVRDEAARDPATYPDVPGAHLEGPFVHPRRLGAQPPHPIVPTPARVHEILGLDVVALVTLAPELDGGVDAAATFAAAGVRVSVGHTVAGDVEVHAMAAAVRAVDGTYGATHLFNAMGGMTSREPGVVGAILASHDGYAEIILDLHHVAPTTFLAARAALGERWMLVTDAMRACGLAEGTTDLGGQTVLVREGAARLADGTLAGSVLTMDAAVRNAVGVGVPLAEAIKHASHVPARYLGLADRGRLEIGLRADLVVLDARLAATDTIVAGRSVPTPGPTRSQP